MKMGHASEIERIRAEEEERQDSELRQSKRELLQAKKGLATTSEALTNLQDEATDWKLSLSKINAELSSKYLFIFASSHIFFLLTFLRLAFRELPPHRSASRRPCQEGSDSKGPGDAHRY